MDDEQRVGVASCEGGTLIRQGHAQDTLKRPPIGKAAAQESQHNVADGSDSMAQRAEDGRMVMRASSTSK